VTAARVVPIVAAVLLLAIAGSAPILVASLLRPALAPVALAAGRRLGQRGSAMM
jgi:hypothetical protein